MANMRLGTQEDLDKLPTLLISFDEKPTQSPPSSEQTPRQQPVKHGTKSPKVHPEGQDMLVQPNIPNRVERLAAVERALGLRKASMCDDGQQGTAGS